MLVPFNQNLSRCEVSNVVAMQGMFWGAFKLCPRHGFVDFAGFFRIVEEECKSMGRPDSDSGLQEAGTTQEAHSDGSNSIAWVWFGQFQREKKW